MSSGIVSDGYTVRDDGRLVRCLLSLSTADLMHIQTRLHQARPDPSPDQPLSAEDLGSQLVSHGLDISDLLVALESDGTTDGVRIAELCLDATGGFIAASDGVADSDDGRGSEGTGGSESESESERSGGSRKRLKIVPVHKHSWCEDSVVTRVADNPKRAGTAAHERFKRYVVGRTVGEAMSGPDGVTRDDVKHDLSRGYIEVAS